MIPYVEGVLTPEQVTATARSIIAVQRDDGAIPWAAGSHVDVWNHVEAAMGLLAAGEVAAAERAYEWVAAGQRPDGSWPMRWRDGVVEDDRGDTNFSAYLAVGLWHHWLIRRDLDVVRRLWPAVRAGLDWVIGLQRPFGGIAWTPVDDLCLLTGNSSIHHSLRAGAALAELVGESRPSWEVAADRLADALRHRRAEFADKSTYSMDWYYPVLGGAVRGAAAADLIESRWDDFVRPGLGVRCVDTNPWVTGAETCELVLALDAIGDHERALALLADMQLLRAEDGGYWTGWVYDDPGYPNDNPDVFWPEEHTTFTAGAVILAVDALGEKYGAATPGSGIFRASCF
ncbi:prenyltransferase [Nocardioides sp.]|uniref:prenyltransferase n=1 Tax=Nocardioides sp. TaxID=35761 RepID=UPI0039E26A70